MKMFRAIIFAVVFAIWFVGCSSSVENQEFVGKTAIVRPVNYGNGVYYFPKRGATFGNSLSAFLKYNPELTVSAMAPGDERGYGITLGYFVVVVGTKTEPTWP